MATDERDVVAVYFPALGTVDLELPEGNEYDAQWYDPRTGELTPALEDRESGALHFVAPLGFDENGHPWDWVLVLQKRGLR